MSNTSTPKISDNSPFNKCLKNNIGGENLLEKKYLKNNYRDINMRFKEFYVKFINNFQI